MTDTTIRPALSSAVADVLERMFFLEGLSEVQEAPQEAETVSVYLSFEGNPPGCFQMHLACEAANAIAADFLGLDRESLTDQQSTDVTLELANMICGAVLSRIESNAAFRLGAPQIATDRAGMHEPKEEETRYTVETGSGTLTAAIQMETRTCPPTQTYAS